MATRSVWLRILAYSGAAGLTGKVGQFFALTLLALAIPPEAFGRFAIAQIVSAGFVSIVSSSFAIAAGRRAAHSASDTPDSVALSAATATFVFRWQFLLVAAFATVCLPLLYIVLAGSGFQLWLIPWAILSSCTVLVDVVSGALAGGGSIRTAGLLDAVRMLTSGILALALGRSFGYVGAAYGLVLFDTILAIVFLISMFSRWRHLDGAMDIQSRRTIGAGVASNGVTQVAVWALTWAIQSSFGLTAVATFSVANRFASLILVAPGLLSRNSLGLLARHRVDSPGPVQIRTIGIYLATTAALTIGASVVVMLAVAFLFPALVYQYDDLWTFLAILLAASVLRALATALGVVCVSWGLLRVWVLSDVASALTILTWTGASIWSESSQTRLLIGLVVGAGVALLIRSVVVWRGVLSLIRSERSE